MSGGTRKRQRVEETQIPENRQLKIVIDILQRKDTHNIFAKPVDGKEVEGYYEIVKEPMDFETMGKKLEDGMYRSLDQFKNDVFLITRNAMQFNASSTIFYKEAREIQKLADKIFGTLATDPDKLESKYMGTRRRSTRIQLVNKSLAPTSRKPPPPPPVTHSQIPTKIRRNDSKLCEGEELLAQDRRCTYTTSFKNEGGGKQLIPSGELQNDGCSYRKSLWLFVRDLGPTAKMVAARKLRSSPSAEHQMQDGKKAAAAASANVNENATASSSANVNENAMASSSSASVSAHVIPVVLALEHSQPNIANPNEYCKLKSRNKKQTNNDNVHTAAAATTMTPMQKLEALMEEEAKKPSASTGAFTFDLGFLKAQLQKMNIPAKSTPPPP